MHLNVLMQGIFVFQTRSPRHNTARPNAPRQVPGVRRRRATQEMARREGPVGAGSMDGDLALSALGNLDPGTGSSVRDVPGSRNPRRQRRIRVGSVSGIHPRPCRWPGGGAHPGRLWSRATSRMPGRRDRTRRQVLTIGGDAGITDAWKNPTPSSLG